MKNKLIYKYIIGFIAFMVLSFITISYLVSSLTYHNHLNNETQSLYQEANYLATKYAKNYYAGLTSLDELDKQLSAVSLYVDSDVMLISTNGTIVLNTGSSATSFLQDFDPTTTGSEHYMINNFYNLYASDHLSVFYPVDYSYTKRGYIVLSKPISVIATESNELFNYNYISMLIVFLFCGIFILIYIMYINIPLSKITNITAHYAKGDFSPKINLHRNDEIGRLSDSLDYMASEINNLNEYQKKFIANISHDFRSPLTSIKGYLEAMLDGTIPVEMQDKYFTIVITETERLTKLTNNLLTMNNITDHGMVLDLTDFDIIHVIKTTVETFEGICEKKKLTFKLVFSSKHLHVQGDQLKIQQVIYNLIDNAIKFSHSESSIIISANEKNDKVLISVKDFGIGIPKESLSKIWDRFYKTDLSRGKDKKGTGLGLSIVKEIINSHKEYIDVVSTEGVGTEFIFALPRAKSPRNTFDL